MPRPKGSKNKVKNTPTKVLRVPVPLIDRFKSAIKKWLNKN